MENNMAIGIVGGSGFVGSSLAIHLSKEFKVKIIDPQRPRIELNKKNMEYINCDIRNYEEVKNVLADLDLVINTAIIQIPLINEEKRLGYEVNIIGTQNLCKAVDENPRTKGLILAGSWHTIGEKELRGIINEEFGFRPDKVEERARLYAISKIAQECIVRYYDEMSQKYFGILRMGTVLGKGMPEKTAANIFIERGLKGESITPYKHSMHRPMLYVDIKDVCIAFESFALKILNSGVKGKNNSLDNVVNVYFPRPVTILQLAKIVQKAIIKHSRGKIKPKIEVIETGQKPLFEEDDWKRIKVDISKAVTLLGLKKLKSPKDVIEELVKEKLQKRSK